MSEHILVTLTHKETIVKTTPCVKNDLQDLVKQLKEVQINLNGLLTDLVNSSGAANNNGGTGDDSCEGDEDDDDEQQDIKKEDIQKKKKRRKFKRQPSKKRLKGSTI
uniref:Uncharacterized protein n=1 Tax=Graphocephala atropunctata TaxID=36148 RepID=A0A1B6LDX9_9HEMI